MESKSNYIGKSIKRVDALAKVTGQAMYPGDFNMPGQLYMKVFFSERPHAIVKNVDITSAIAITGVVAILTAKDVPNNEYGLSFPDQPVLCGPGSEKEYADRVRFIGDQIAVVIAETEEIANKARSLIKVVYEDLPIIEDATESLKADAFLIHPELGKNEFCHYKIRKGDVDLAFNQCDIVIEEEYYTPVQEHIYLQPEAGLAYLDEDGLITVVVAGQWAHEDQEQIAHALNLPKEQIRIIYPAIGGAFGGREDMSVQIILALGVLRLHERGIDRPIKIIWNREESIIGHHKRHAFKMKAKWGATKEGKILAAENLLIADGGAYAYTSTKVLGNATLLTTGPYDIPNVKTDSLAVYTNNVPGGAFRGFGGPQANFLAEMQIARLAEALNIDPIEIRMRNLFDEGSFLSVGTKLPEGVSIKQVVETSAKKAGWQESANGWSRVTSIESQSKGKGVRKGLGFACGYKNIGFSFGYHENCHARIELFGTDQVERAVLYHAGAEVGQGAHTVFAQFAADALNLPLERIDLKFSDTKTSKSSGSVSASRMTFMAGNSIIGAAKWALEKWAAEERPAVGDFTYWAPKTTPYDLENGQCMPNITYGYVAVTVEAEVNVDTGKVTLNKVICVDDVGTAINPKLIEGQIEGAVVQAAGYALMEKFIQEKGMVKTSMMSTYLIPTILDIPTQVDSVILEIPDPLGPRGARGMGEMPYLPFASAVVDAVHDATGVWFTDFPLTQERVLQGLGKI